MTVLILTISCLKFCLATHLKWVKGMLVALCDVCGRTFTSKKNFISHLQSTCHGKKTFNCDLCDKVFQFKKGMDEHKSTIHGEHFYKCEFRNQTFQKKSNLTRHKIKQHVTGPVGYPASNAFLLKTSTVTFRAKIY